MKEYEKYLDEVREKGLHRTLPPITLKGKWVEIDGQQLLNLNSNDYLGLLGRPELWQEFLQEASSYQPGSGSSRLLTGNDQPYQALEATLKEAYGAESALVWSSGYHANSGIIPVLNKGKALFIADRLVHASIIDGIRLSGADFTRYRHNDLEQLQSYLSQRASQYEHIWLITESLFSMDGDFAPLEALVAIKKEFPNLHLYVDEAHAVGVYGPQGLGLTAQLGLLREVDLLVCTFGKAYAGYGAFSIQSQVLRELLVSQARSLIFSTALPPVVVAWNHFIFQKVMDMEEERATLQGLIAHLAQLLDLPNQKSQIVPVIIPGSAEVIKAATELERQGFYIRAIRPPTVPAGQERLRISLTATLTEEELRYIEQALKRL